MSAIALDDGDVESNDGFAVTDDGDNNMGALADTSGGDDELTARSAVLPPVRR